MNFPNVEAFDEKMAPFDHSEAILIDRAFNRIGGNLVDYRMAEEEIDPTILEVTKQAAIEGVETDLSDLASKSYHEFPELFIPTADVFGYATAKRAVRWWRFREAYLKDLEAEYNDNEWEAPFSTQSSGYITDMDHPTPESQMIELMKQHSSVSDKLFDGDSAMTRLYASLEQYRWDRFRSNDPVTHALVPEHGFAFGALVFALDQRLEQETAVQLWRHFTLFVMGNVPFDDGQAKVSVLREQRPTFSRYSIRVTPDNYVETERDRSIGYIPPTQFTLKHYPGTSDVDYDSAFGTLNPKMMSTEEAMQLLAACSTNQANVFQQVLESN